MKYHGVLIIDFGSQFTQVIARRVREHRVYSEIHRVVYDISSKPPATIKWE